LEDIDYNESQYTENVIQPVVFEESLYKLVLIST